MWTRKVIPPWYMFRSLTRLEKTWMSLQSISSSEAQDVFPEDLFFSSGKELTKQISLECHQQPHKPAH